METDSSLGIYDLVSGLCEKFAQDPSRIKPLRSKCYEILLGKRTPKVKKKFKDLSTEDATCNLLAWQYVLSHQYNLSKFAEQITGYHEFIHDSYENDKKLDTYQSILKFLLNLRDVPTIKDDQTDLSLLPEFGPDPNFNELFKLPSSIICESINYADSSFYFKPRKREFLISGLDKKPSCSCPNLSHKNSCNSFRLKELEEAKVQNVSLQEEDDKNIWEIAASEKYSNKRNWENYGYPEPEKEPRFLTELGDLSSLWVDNLHSIYFPKLFRDGMVLRPEVKCKRNFIRDLKYLLVGMASESFTYNDFGELILIPEITLEGITEETLEVYSKDFTLGGTCYKALYDISLPDPYTNKYRCAGYIFAELCKSLNKYLKFYRTAIMSISDCMNLLEFSEKTSHLRNQIATLASICKVGPYKESEEMPHGVALLNYLYQKVSEVIDRKIILVLYSILFPCCQIYFGLFILQWILDGSVNDPYDEFFIKTNYKYISTRGRTYWTRSFIIRQDIIPDFLNELKDSILLCGKMMNLLKLCHPFSKLCLYLMGKKPQIVSCCITKNQLIVLEQSALTYYLEASEVCGPKLSLALIIRKDKELNEDLLEYISEKRAATLKRIELERQKSAQEEYEKKLEERAMLKEQYDMALHQKQFHILQDIERDIKVIETSIQIEKKKETLIQQEAKDMIEYYEQLFKISDARREKIEKHIELLKNCQLDPTQKQHLHARETDIGGTSSKDSEKEPAHLFMISEVNMEGNAQNEDEIPSPEIHSSKSLDELNANLNESEEAVQSTKEDTGNNNSTKTSDTPVNDNFAQTLKNFEIAKRNKRKVMNEELGMTIGDVVTDESKVKVRARHDSLTDAQKNKFKIMSSEFDIDIQPRERIEKELTISDINKFKMMSSTVFNAENYIEKNIDNENIVNKNVTEETSSVNDKTKEAANKIELSISDINKRKVMSSTIFSSENYVEIKIDNLNNKIINVIEEEKYGIDKSGGSKTTMGELSESKIKKSSSLSLDFNFKRDAKCSSDTEKFLPMSVDSTPLSEIASISTTASRIFLSEDKVNLGSFPTTAGTEMTDDGGFKFNENYSVPESSDFQMDKTVFSKNFSSEDVKNIRPMCLKMFLSESLSYSLAVQAKLVSSELLSYFINDLNYLQHLKNLKNYFFLQDGEFGKTVTESLFQKLYAVKFPIELINCRVLSYIIHGALEDTRRTDGFNNLSFKINNLPDGFNLGDVDVLNCLSLAYKVDWPLNILLPCDAIAKYNEIFKFLLKINRMTWILKKIFMNLRMLAKEAGVKEQYLMMSVHYRRIHQFRYVMMHFVQTLQNYITGEVFQTQWALYEKNLERVTNLDELYDAHTHYLKNILFMCLLNQRSAPLKRVFDKIFTVILKFYDHLRSKKWECKDGTFVHPSFTKLETIFENFNELILYLFKVGKKVVKNGYQPHFKHFLDSLNANGYYSKILVF